MIRAKFLFNDDFGAPPPPPAVDTVALAVHAAEVEVARNEGFSRGVAEGRRQAEAEAAAHLAAAMQRLAFHFGDVAQGLSQAAAEAERQAGELALALSLKLMRAFADKYPLAQTEHLARSIFGQLRGAPHAVVRVSSETVDAAKPRLDAIARETGFAGAIVVLGEPDMTAGDARVEWADGGAVHDSQALERMLADAVQRCLTSPNREETRP